MPDHPDQIALAVTSQVDAPLDDREEVWLRAGAYGAGAGRDWSPGWFVIEALQETLRDLD